MRIIVPSISFGQISEIEAVIVAQAYPERVRDQDKICSEIKEFITSKVNNLKAVYVWLQLSELGHSP